MKRLLFVAFVCLFASQLPLGAASPVVISEFMADNTRTLFDEDGDSEDWIEIRNVSDASVNLLDWSLTDAAGNLTKWRFPATNLNVGAYMVVFASNKDRRTPGRPLHTNFRLDPDGEFLALVEPGGTTIASVFSPRYPFQVPNVSFGSGLVSSNTSLLAVGAAARVLVPTAGNGGSTLGDTWKGGSEPFNDSGWRSGPTGIGFSANGAPSLVATSSLMVRLNFDAAPAGTVLADTKPIGAPINGANGAGAAGATWLPSSTDQAANPVSRSGVMQFVAPENDQITLPANPVFNAARGTISFWMRSFGFFGPAQGPAVVFDRETITGNLTSGGLIFQNPDGRLQFITYSNGNVAALATTVSSPSDDRWHHIAVVYDQHPTTGFASIFIDGAQEVSVANTRGWTWPAAAALELGRSHEAAFRKYQGLLDDFRFYNKSLDSAEVAGLAVGDGGVPASDTPTNIETEMLNINSSAFVRIPFNVANPAAFSLLTLRVRHNDGFVAWLNGQLIASVNAPETVQWDSAATAAHAGSLGDSATIGNPATVLRAGANVLAIQGLNLSAGDPTFLVLPELVGTSVPVDSSAGLYFTQPTPGAANTGGTTNTGPAITEVAHIPNVPVDSEDVRVSARVTPTFSAVGGVTLRYRIMYANEVSVPMNDNGTAGDLVAGDGVWSALIPASASTNGQMIRYLIAASDALGASAKWPLFYNPTNSEQYLGTIVDPTNVVSKLPIYHLFINPTDQGAADAEGGARCAVFYDGEFYDNVRIELRGNTSAGFRKKAHRIEFNRDHRFRHLTGYPRIGDTSFLGESADPAYMRQMFCFSLADAMGVPSPFSYPVRLQNNSVFYQLALHSDVMGIEQLERLGYEPHGALYKAVGQLRPTFESTGGFEKRTRLYEDRSDYLALANGINESQNLATRATNVFDMLDVPNVINYLVVARWATEADDVWANMTIYRDSEGDQLWRVIPFDMNVSWGQLYCGDSLANFNAIIATNDNFKSHPLYGGQTVLPTAGGANWNRLYDSIVRIPATREMLLRRMRSLLDEFILPPDLHPSAYTMERQFLSFSNSVYAESILDRLRWGWEANPGAANGPYCYGTNVWMTNHLTDIINQYVIPRRRHWYATHSITNTARTIGIANANNAGIPLSQPGNAVVTVTRIEFNPSTGNQDEEFICLTNGNPYAVDLSGWKLGGGVEFTFKGGTVMPSNSVLYVSPNTRAFRSRAVAPRGGMGLFAVGPYNGQLSARGEPLTITDKTGRLVYTNFFLGNPSAPQQFLRITEIMYNPSPLAGNTNDAQEFEYIELKNISSGTISLAGVRFINGINFDFTGSAVTSLAAGQRVLVVRNLSAFTARYGAANVAGQYSLNLDNAGERIQLVDAANEEIHDFSYNNSWYPITDGAGFSLVVVNEAGETGAWNTREGWRPNGTLTGAPGQPDPPPPTFAGILINEVLSHTDFPEVDAIELLNPTASAVNIGGWFLSDDFEVPRKYRIPNGAVIPAGGHLSFDESLFNNAATAIIPFAVSSRGDDVWLFSGDANTNLTGYVFGEDFGAAATGVSLGRYTNSVGSVHFVAQTANSLNAANAGPRVGPVVISEIMYHPPDFADGTDNSEDEYIELRNITGTPVPLYNINAPTNTWRLREAVEYDFPSGVTLPANGMLLLVSFNTLEARKLAAFRTRFDVPPEVPVYGPYRGQLDNSSDDIRLERPDNPEAGDVPYIRVDRVEYQDTNGWPSEADGNIPSLQRRDVLAYGNDPTNWVAVGPSAGRPHIPGGTPPTVVTQPANVTAIVGRSATLSVAVGGTAPFFYQWRFNNENIYGANSAVLSIPVLQADQAGTYNVVIFNSAGSVQSADAQISVLFPPTVVLQPTNRNVRIRPDPNSAPATNVTFTTAGSSINSALSYQWRFNGVNIPGAIGASVTITNVQIENEGFYSCAISDSVDTVETVGARLTPWISPTVVQAPVGQAIADGSDFSMSVQVNGHPPPFGYSWRRSSIVIASNNSPSRSTFITLNSTAVGLILTNNILASNYIMRLVVYNEANSAPGLLMTYTNTILADLDRDGIPDVVEEGLGLSTNNAADAALDLDGDTLSNYDEYVAGTDPTNRLSYLKVDSITTGEGTMLTFGAVSNRSYTVQYSDFLIPEEWASLTDVLARANSRVETTFDPLVAGNRYYRVVTPAQEPKLPSITISNQPTNCASSDGSFEIQIYIKSNQTNPHNYNFAVTDAGNTADLSVSPDNITLSKGEDWTLTVRGKLKDKTKDGKVKLKVTYVSENAGGKLVYRCVFITIIANWQQ
jgi:hypothetical protein